MKNLLWPILLLLGLIMTPILGDGADYMQIVDVGTSARQVALGGIYGFSNGSDTVFENPAGLYRIQHSGMSFFTTTFMSEVYYNCFTLSGQTPIGSVGFGYMEATVFDLSNTGMTDQNVVYEKGLFDYKDSVYKLSYGVSPYANFHLGMSFVYYSKSFFDINGRGSDIDLGAIYDGDRYQLSVGIENAFTNDVLFNEGKIEHLVRRVRYGGKYRFNEFDVYGQITQANSRALLASGLIYHPTFLSYIHLIFGAHDFLVLNDQKRTGSMGVGLDLLGVNVFYAYEKSDYVLNDNKHYFSMNVNF